METTNITFKEVMAFDFLESKHKATDVISDLQKLSILYSALCNSYSMNNSGYWLSELQMEDEFYVATKEIMKKIMPIEGAKFCIEDIFIQYLLEGYELKVVDAEDDSNDTTLNLQKVLANFSKLDFTVLSNYIQGNDDANDGDLVLQTLVHGEVLFG